MQGTGRQERSVVETVDFLDGKTLEQPVVKHGLGAVPRFFSRLENETDGAVEFFRSLRSLAAPRRVTVWPSWPQPCILPGFWDTWSCWLHSWMFRRPYRRMPMQPVPSPTFQGTYTPVPPMPSATSMPIPRISSATSWRRSFPQRRFPDADGGNAARQSVDHEKEACCLA